MKTYTKSEISDLADEAGNLAIAHIQDKLGQKYGDFAGLYFSGNAWEKLTVILESYITAEIQEGLDQLERRG